MSKTSPNRMRKSILLFIGSIVFPYVLRKRRRCKAITLTHPNNLCEKVLTSQKMTEEIKKYCDNFYLSLFDPSGLLHSIWYVITRKIRFHKMLTYSRELLILEDGGRVALDWRIRNANTDSPVVVIHHGLCGHSQSSYIRSMIIELESQGFYCVVFVARGCGKNTLTTPETFTASRTGDFKSVIKHVYQMCNGRDIHAIGFSLGAGLLLKYLGETGNSNNYLTSAVAISPSFDFHIKTSLFGCFSSIAVKGLKKYIKDNRDFLQNHPSSMLDWDGMMKSKNIYEFDQAAIVGRYRNDNSGRFLHHPTVEEYYSTSSCIHVASQIEIPTLALCSVDDPVCSVEGAPISHSQIGRGLAVVIVQHGGHVGFGDSPFVSSFFCDRIAGLWMSLLSGAKQKV